MDPLGSSPLSLIVMTHTFLLFLNQARRTLGLRFVLSQCSSMTHSQGNEHHTLRVSEYDRPSVDHTAVMGCNVLADDVTMSGVCVCAGATTLRRLKAKPSATCAGVIIPVHIYSRCRSPTAVPIRSVTASPWRDILSSSA